MVCEKEGVLNQGLCASCTIYLTMKNFDINQEVFDLGHLAQ